MGSVVGTLVCGLADAQLEQCLRCCCIGQLVRHHKGRRKLVGKVYMNNNKGLQYPYSNKQSAVLQRETDPFKGGLLRQSPKFIHRFLVLFAKEFEHVSREGLAPAQHDEHGGLKMHILQRDYLAQCQRITFQHDSLQLAVHLGESALDQPVYDIVLNEAPLPHSGQCQASDLSILGNLVLNQVQNGNSGKAIALGEFAGDAVPDVRISSGDENAGRPFGVLGFDFKLEQPSNAFEYLLPVGTGAVNFEVVVLVDVLDLLDVEVVLEGVVADEGAPVAHHLLVEHLLVGFKLGLAEPLHPCLLHVQDDEGIGEDARPLHCQGLRPGLREPRQNEALPFLAHGFDFLADDADHDFVLHHRVILEECLDLLAKLQLLGHFFPQQIAHRDGCEFVVIGYLQCELANSEPRWANDEDFLALWGRQLLDQEGDGIIRLLHNQRFDEILEQVVHVFFEQILLYPALVFQLLLFIHFLNYHTQVYKLYKHTIQLLASLSCMQKQSIYFNWDIFRSHPSHLSQHGAELIQNGLNQIQPGHNNNYDETMKRTVYHISSQFLSSPSSEQSSHLFPFLHSPSISGISKSMIRYRQIQGVCNLGNVSSVVPLPMPCKEFIFFGKSNVGKSTLLNRLMQEEVAAVSKRPGKTKELLVCEVGPKSQVDSRITESKIFFVDCPGYGYATGVSKREIGQWGRLITTYLKRSSDNLMNQRFLCLLDINQQLKETDALVFQLLKSNHKHFILVFTKCDKMGKGNHEQQTKTGLQTAAIIQKKYQEMNYYVHFTSCRTMTGIHELRNHIMFDIISDKL